MEEGYGWGCYEIVTDLVGHECTNKMHLFVYSWQWI